MFLHYYVMKKPDRPKLGETLKKPELRKTSSKSYNIDSELKKLHSKPSETKQIRTTIYLPEELHKEIKIHCIQNGNISMKDFIIEAVEFELVRNKTKP